VHDGGTAIRRPLDRGKVEKIVTVATVITDHFMAKAFQVGRYMGTHVPAMPGDKNPHDP
jgi:hypothetical protein